LKNIITIVGKNSLLYSSVKKELEEKSVYIIEYSHKEIWNLKSIENPVIFSYSKKNLSENLELIKFISTIKKGKLIYISTTATFANSYSNSYKYPILKKQIENCLIKMGNVSIIRVGVVSELVDLNQFHGTIKISTSKLISRAITDNINYNSNNIYTDAWTEKEIESTNNRFKLFLNIEKILFDLLGDFFFMTRPLDLFFRFLNYKNYGYTFLSNNYKIKKHENTIIGAGMSSFGVLTAIKESKSNLDSTIIIHDFSSKLFHSVNKKNVEYRGNGGNSNYWHSVISIFRMDKELEAARRHFFTLFYNKSYNFLNKGFSFIPLKPLRPLAKIIKIINKSKIIDDELIYIEKSIDNAQELILHTKRNTFYTDRVFLCTGTISSLDLLFKSNLIKDDKVVLSEHLVGYFGQVILNKKSNLDRTIFKFNGHFKRFHNILLKPNRSMFVTLRPALFGFKSLETASSFRDFFGRGSSSIFINLIKKFNLALILEAMYNKFGIKFFSSKRYNIAGHIESKNSVSIQLSTSANPKIIYAEKNIKLNKDEIDNINKYLNSKYNIDSIIISEKTSVSPGLHFLNASNIGMIPIDLNGLAKDHIYPFGTYLFQNHAPTHPTYDLFVDSYLKTKKILC
jgi:hypothetical protein